MPAFDAVVELNGRTATGIEVPAAVLEALAGGKRPAVVVTIGSYSYRTTVGSMGGRSMVPLSAENRTAAGVSAGESVRVTIETDSAPRVVEVPEDFAVAMAAQPPALERFDALAFSHRKEHVRAIEEAKTEATRARRIAKAIEKLLA